MHIELIDLLRCPEPHEETWLVAAFSRMEGRVVHEAKLGCPVCRREYPVRDGVATFGDGISPECSAGDATHIAAFLNLSSSGKTVLLAGALAEHSEAIAAMAEARVISLNATKSKHDDHVLEIRTNSRIPLSSSSLDGIALDKAHSAEELMREAERVIRPGGRIVYSIIAAPAGGFHELARDDDFVVAEKVAELTMLQRKAGR
ncbi:MAG TPA: hypothetical protein VM099_09405 [Gemmatimonadaceae bacterium]|nr:hypothetical protein [Gemmatimonadaceae bacterium]